MSRSRKRSPVLKDSPRRSKKFWLRQAARRVRHADFDVADGGAYRNLYDRYNICDWRFRHTFDAYLRRMIRLESQLALARGRDPVPVDSAEARREWRRNYYNK